MIKMSAIMIFDDGFPTIITAKRHAQCLEKARRYGFDRLSCTEARQGFLDTLGTFYNREDAANEAFRCSQISVKKKRANQRRYLATRLIAQYANNYLPLRGTYTLKNQSTQHWVLFYYTFLDRDKRRDKKEHTSLWLTGAPSTH